MLWEGFWWRLKISWFPWLLILMTVHSGGWRQRGKGRSQHPRPCHQPRKPASSHWAHIGRDCQHYENIDILFISTFILLTLMTTGNIQVVYFDVLGIFMLHFSSLTGLVLNILILAITLVSIYKDIQISRHRENASSEDTMMIMAIFMVWVSFIGSLIAVIFSALVAILLPLAGRDMSWFASPS